MNQFQSDMQALRKDLVVIGKRLFDQGMVTGTGGNISALVPGTNKALLKKSSICLGDACEEDFLLVDLDGNLLEGEGKPSKEFRFHVDIYKIRPDVRAVIHAHSPHIIAFSLVEAELPLLTVQAKFHARRVPRIPDLPPGSKELAEQVTRTFSDTSLRAVMMEAHGITVVGADIWQASYVLGVVEEAAKTAFLYRQLIHR